MPEMIKTRVVLCVQADGSYTGEGWTNATVPDVIRAIEENHQIEDPTYHFVVVEAEVPLPEPKEDYTVQASSVTIATPYEKDEFDD